jgi:hypothetical protein
MSVASDFPPSRERDSRLAAIFSSCARSAKKLDSKLQMLLCLLVSISSEAAIQAQEVHWNGNAGNGHFFDNNNWSPFGAPQTQDVIPIGNLPGTAGDEVVMGGQPGILHGDLYLSNGVSPDTNGSELVSFEIVSLVGTNTRLIARPAPGPNARPSRVQFKWSLVRF